MYMPRAFGTIIFLAYHERSWLLRRFASSPSRMRPGCCSRYDSLGQDVTQHVARVDGVRIVEQVHLHLISLPFDDSHQLASFLRSMLFVHEASQEHAVVAGLQRVVCSVNRIRVDNLSATP
jgi:hypothetical protein